MFISLDENYQKKYRGESYLSKLQKRVFSSLRRELGSLLTLRSSRRASLSASSSFRLFVIASS